MNCFGFLHYIYSFFFTVLVVYPHHDHPITTVLTHSTLLWRDMPIVLLKVPLNIKQTNKQTNYDVTLA